MAEGIGKRPVDRALLDALSARVGHELGDLLPARPAVALVGFPNYGNPGDAAIWLGTRRVLRRLGVEVGFQCEYRTYRRGLLRAAMGDRPTILLQGGGNVGDAYAAQSTRERVLRDFRTARVVQLPQSIWFRRERGLERFRRLCERHDDLTLMVRERASLAIAKERLGVEAVLCPDMAFALGPLERLEHPSVEVVWLARRGRERRQLDPSPVPEGVVRGDWGGRRLLARPGTRWLRTLMAASHGVRGIGERDGRAARALWRAGAALHDPLARARLRAGVRFLSDGRAVVTDRLHGHVLALLLGIPHVAMDNAYGKVRALYETWTADSELARWADDPAAGLELAAALAAGRMG